MFHRSRRFVSLAAVLAVASLAAGQAPVSPVSADQSPAAGLPVVIIHGAWGGSHHWQDVTGSLSRAGRDVTRASLTGLGPRVHLATPETDLQTHVTDVVNLIEFESLDSVILIAHSYGGVVASGVAEQIPERIAHVIYLDAHLLSDGETYLTHHPDQQAKLVRRAEEAGDGWLVPVDWKNEVRDVPHPIATLTQPLKLSRERSGSVPSSYWLFCDGKEPSNDERYRYLERAKSRGYRTRELAWGHNPQRAIPDELARELLLELEIIDGDLKVGTDDE